MAKEYSPNKVRNQIELRGNLFEILKQPLNSAQIHIYFYLN